jgi:hypothetical protein
MTLDDGFWGTARSSPDLQAMFHKEMTMVLVRFGLPVFILALSVQGCGVERRDSNLQQQQAVISEQKEEIVARLVPEERLNPPNTRLIEATIQVLGKGDREELRNPAHMRSTLRAASLENLRAIEANYKERVADGQ